mgnify:CR=1 FL=1
MKSVKLKPCEGNHENANPTTGSAEGLPKALNVRLCTNLYYTIVTVLGALGALSLI